MEDNERESLIQRYSDRLKEFGYSPKTLGWPKDRHRLRYRILLEQWDLTGKSILDFGCGFGDMYQEILKQEIDARYTGIDLNQDLIAEGKRVYPQARLMSGDFLSDGLPETFDFVFSSGVHNLKLHDNKRFIEDSFQFFDSHSTQGFAINFLSNKVSYELESTFHSDPADILNLAYRYSNRVTLRNDYMPFEFSVFVDKRNDFDSDLAVYPEFTSSIK